jgi:hypothetical protein
MKNIHILATDKPSKLIYNDANDLCYQSKKSAKNDRKWMYRKKFHIYITSDDEIKKGDWYFNSERNKIIKVGHHGHYAIFSKKVILTTDPDLIADGIQAIDDEFLEWFVDNSSCEFVELRTSQEFLGDDYRHGGQPTLVYKIIIPQEEPEQETLEEAAVNYGWRVKTNTFSDPVKANDLANSAKEDFIEGAKWQAEQIPYIIEQYLETAFISKEQGYMNPKEWFEQFKK